MSQRLRSCSPGLVTPVHPTRLGRSGSLLETSPFSQLDDPFPAVRVELIRVKEPWRGLRNAQAASQPQAVTVCTEVLFYMRGASGELVSCS